MLLAVLFQILLPFISSNPTLPQPVYIIETMHISYMDIPVTVEFNDVGADVNVMGHIVSESPFVSRTGPCSGPEEDYYYTLNGGVYVLCGMTVEVEGETLTGVVGDVRIPLN